MAPKWRLGVKSKLARAARASKLCETGIKLTFAGFYSAISKATLEFDLRRIEGKAQEINSTVVRMRTSQQVGQFT